MGFWLSDLAGVADLGLLARPHVDPWKEEDRETGGREWDLARVLGHDPEFLAWANGPAPVGVSMDKTRPPMLDVSGLRHPYPWWAAYEEAVFIGPHPKAARRMTVRFWPKECGIDMRTMPYDSHLPRRWGHDPVLRGKIGTLVAWPVKSWRDTYTATGHPYCVKFPIPIAASWPEGAIGAWTHAPAADTELELIDGHGDTIWP